MELIQQRLFNRDLALMLGLSEATIRTRACRSPERLPPARIFPDGMKGWLYSDVMRWLSDACRYESSKKSISSFNAGHRGRKHKA